MTKKKEANLHGLIANLIQELIDMGYNEKDLVFIKSIIKCLTCY